MITDSASGEKKTNRPLIVQEKTVPQCNDMGDEKIFPLISYFPNTAPCVLKK